MADPKKEDFCTYATFKVDDEVLPIVKAAAAFKGVKVQDYISDVLNAQSAKDVGRKPVKRRPPPPRKRAD